MFRPTQDKNLPLPFGHSLHCQGAFNYSKDLLGQIRSEIDAGHPVALGLIAPGPIGQLTGKNHANVVWGYSGDTLKVYDCNYPDECGVTVSPNAGSGLFETAVSGTVKDTWRGIYPKQAYSSVVPSYLDLVRKSGVVLKDSGGSIVSQIDIGQSIQPEYTIRNQGEYPARLNYYYLAVRKVAGNGVVNGANEDFRLGLVDTDSDPTNDIILAPGTDFQVTKRSSAFDIPSWYLIFDSFRSKQGDWLDYNDPNNQAHQAWIAVQNHSISWLTGTTDPQGHVFLFGRRDDGQIMYRVLANGVWSQPATLAGYLPDASLIAGNFPDGRLIVVHRGTTTHAYYRIYQNNAWDTQWNDLQGALISCPFILISQGKLRICAMWQGGVVKFREEQSPGIWSNWANL
jgi:hypothetical protein